MATLKAKHRAEKDALLTELQVFKSVLEGMAEKIRYLQDFKYEGERMQMEVIKQKHVNERMRREVKEVRRENRVVVEKLERLKEACIRYD